jgi:HlyD family secretion protein
MAQANPTKGKIPLGRVIGGVVVLALIAAGVVFGPQLLQRARQGTATSSTAPKTAVVTTITAVTSVTSAGAVTAVQSGAVGWKTSGTVTAVQVKPGDQVAAGAELMRLDPLSVPQNVILAQADLIAAQRALDDLLTPPALTVAQAQKNVEKAQDTLADLLTPPALAVAQAQQAVAKARDALDRAQTALDTTQQPDLKYYREQVQRAQDALTNAAQNTTLVDIGALQVSLRNAQKQLQTATDVYNNAQEAFGRCPACVKVFAYDRMTTWEDAVNLYTDAVNQVQQLQTQIDQAQRGNAQSMRTTQDNLDTAQQRLAEALAAPDAIVLGVNQAAVQVAVATVADAQEKLDKLVAGNANDQAVARAALADAQDKLKHLVEGADPRDVAVARARLEAAQATVAGLTLTAPFGGEVLVVNFQAGDAVAAGQAAVVLADRSVLRVEAQVDETDIGQIQVGDPVSVTLEALPEVALAGTVTWINGSGTTVQGLVKYTVRIELAQSDPRVLLGMTANVAIVTDRQAGALAVPLDAVQLDQAGEYVNRVTGGVVERVKVVSGQIDGDLVVVTGALQPGDEVQVLPPQASNNLPFGSGMGGAGGQ